MASMASPRRDSPSSPAAAAAVAAARKSRDETLMDKIGTLARKKKVKEVDELEAEGKTAIESPSSPVAPELAPESYLMEENEERSMLEPHCKEDPKLKELIGVLLDWINDELAEYRIIVKDVEEDFYDGQVLQKLIEKLAKAKLDIPEVTQSEFGQKQKLGKVLDTIKEQLNLPKWNQSKWTVDTIHAKNLVSTLHLLVALATHYGAPARLPDHVHVNILVVQKREGILHTRQVIEEITGANDGTGAKFERDAFDTLFDHAPDKLSVVKKSLITFVNKHLNKINLEVTELESQFHDGVYFSLLMGLLEGYFVPLYSFHLTPSTFEEKTHNVSFAFTLMQDAGLPKPKARPEDVVNTDLKSTLRVLYNLFTKYKHLS